MKKWTFPKVRPYGRKVRSIEFIITPFTVFSKGKVIKLSPHKNRLKKVVFMWRRRWVSFAKATEYLTVLPAIFANTPKWQAIPKPWRRMAEEVGLPSLACRSRSLGGTRRPSTSSGLLETLRFQHSPSARCFRNGKPKFPDPFLGFSSHSIHRAHRSA
jgi:hypothetical protein